MADRDALPARPRRADARRNYDLLLAAATEVFAERGVDAPLDDIARRAGVGNATMYRHFPTRRELIVAVYADQVTELCDRGSALLAEAAPADALFDWLRLFVAHVAGKRDLALALRAEADPDRSAVIRAWHDAMLATAEALVRRAQDAGVVRAEVTAVDLLQLVNGISLAASDPAAADRLLALVRQGAAQVL